MMNEEVRTIMSIKVTTATPDQHLAEVLALMERKRLQQLPVVEDGKLVGLITTYDLWQHCRNNPDCEKEIVANVMTQAVVKLDGKLKGVVTAFDVIRYSFRKEYPDPILYKDRIMA
jgi:CBS domain-containing protein